MTSKASSQISPFGLRPGLLVAGVVATLLVVALDGRLSAGSLTIVSPAGASSGVTIQLTGTGFNATAANNDVTFTPAGGTPMVAVPTATTVVDASRGLRRLTLRVPDGLAIGTAAISVLNKATGETSAGVSIEVLGLSLPEVDSASPGTSNLKVRILGSPNAIFGVGSRAVFGAGITVHSTTVESATSIVATLSVGANAALGPRNVTVQASTHTAVQVDGFSVVAAPPPPPANLAPVVSAGAPVTIGSGGIATLQGSASDDGLPANSTLQVLWSKQSGPGAVTFATATAAETTATFGKNGTYTLRLTATDGDKSAFAETTVTVAPNKAPTVSASVTPEEVVRPATVALNADVADDGLPSGSSLSLAWTKRKGPGNVTFSAPSAAASTASFSKDGTYTLRLTASDGKLSGFAEVTVVARGNLAPTVSAGADQSVTLAAGASLAATVDDDGLPQGSTVSVTWTKQSGPGKVTFTPPNAATTTATFAKVGTYVLKITATDGDKNASDSVTVVVTASAVNVAPTVSAGADVEVTLPATAALQGSVSDDGLPTNAPVTVAWSKVSGPGTVSFAPAATSAQVTASFSTAGTYVLRLTATDTDKTSFDEVSVEVKPATTPNQAPTVNAGTDQTITLPETAALSAHVTDDDKPTGAPVTLTWSKFSGPGTVTFNPPNAAQTTATFSAPGAYVLRLTASDTALQGSDDVAVLVNPTASVNAAPVVNAGDDQTVTFPSPAALVATVTDDNLPAGASLTYVWSKFSGPGTVTFGAANAPNTSATFSEPGDYVLRLEVSDSDKSAHDDIAIRVNPPTATNTAPVVNAGDDQSIVLPAFAKLAGVVTDDGRPTAVLTIAWRKVEGPGEVSFTPGNAAESTAAFSAAGKYELELRASDGELATTDTLIVNVAAPTAANVAPAVSAGNDQQVPFELGAALSGLVSDDGKPSTTLLLTWRKVSGPGVVTFANSSTAQTAAEFDRPGVYVLSLTASDGELSATDDIAITVADRVTFGDVTPPIVKLHAPTEALPGAVIELTATATDDVGVAGVAFEINGGAPQDTTQAPYTRTFTVPELAEPGTTIAVRVVGRDAAGNTGEATAVIAVSVTPDTQNPDIQLRGPSGVSPGFPVRLVAIAKDNVGVAGVTFFVGTQEIAAATETPYEATYLVPGDTPPTAPVVVTARARDFAGNTADATWSVQVLPAAQADTTEPDVTLTVPEQVVAGTLLPIAAEATDASGIAGVSFRIGEGLLLGVDVEVPYATSYAVPALLAPGTVIEVVAEATDYAGLKKTATKSVTVLSSDGAVAAVTGEVYDDTTSLPLAGAMVALVGQDASGAPYTQTATADARGRYLLRASPGQGILQIQKQGFTRVDRIVTFVSGQAIETLDARLTPFRGITQSISPVLGGTLGTDVQAVLPPGTLAQTEALQLVRVGQQGIQGRLPYGWSPIGGADIAPHGIAFAGTGVLRVPNAFNLTGNTTVLLAQWDAVSSAWRMRGVARLAGGQFEADIHATGHYQLVVPDSAPQAPPVPAAGGLLAAVDAPVLPVGLDTEIAPQPQVLFYRPGVFSDVRGRITAATPLTSGAVLLARLTESYTFFSGTEARPEPFLEDLIAYQAGGPATALTATTLVTPSLTFDPLSLERGVIAVELFAPGAIVPLTLVGANGGQIDGPSGIRLAVPVGAVSDSSPIVLGNLDSSDLGPLPAGLTLVHGVQVTVAEALARSASLSVPKPGGVTSASGLLLVRFQDIKGATRPVLVGVVRLEGDRLVTDTIVAGQQTALPGVREAGRYAFVQSAQPLGFAGGLVRGTDAQVFAGALVTSSTLPVVSLSNVAGGYLAAAPVGGVTLTALDLVKSDTGTAASFLAEGGLLPVTLQLVAQPPRVTDLSPANGAVNVPLSGTVIVTFSEAIDPSSVAGANLANILLADAGGTRIEGVASLSQGNTVLTFRPTTALAPNASYRITIGTGVKDTSGYGLVADVTAQFESLDTNPPAQPAAGQLSASIPNAQGLTTVSGTQGTAAPTDRVFVDNLTKKTTAVALVDPNGSFSTVIVAGLTDKLRVRIVDGSGNETTQDLGVFKQTNADGSVSQAVGAEGGVVDGPGGLRATIKPGTFPAGAAVTLNAVSNEQIPITFTPQQAEVFEKQGGFSIDFGGATPAEYVDVSVPAGPNDSEADQWIVAEVVDLDGETLYNITDTAKFRDGRITTASPPCPGVTAAGVYGLTKAKQTYGLNYAEMYANGRYTLRARLEYFAANLGPFGSPFNALSVELPKPVCFPVITGRVTIVPNTVRLHVAGGMLTPTDREILITNTTRGGATPVSYSRTVSDYVFDNPWPGQGGLAGSQYRGVMKAGGLEQRVPILVDTLNGVEKLIVRAGYVSIPATSIVIVDITREREASLPVPLQPFEASVTGGTTDTFEVVAVPRPAVYLSTADAPAAYLLRRSVAHTKEESPYGAGNLVLKVLPGTIDPTREEMNQAGVNGPARTHTYLAASKLGIGLIPNDRIVQGGIDGLAFTGHPDDDYNFVVVYDSRPNFMIQVPRTRLVVTNTITGDIVSDRFIQAPPRDEPVEIEAIIDDSVDPVVVSGPSRVDNFDPTSLLTFRFSESMNAQSVKDNFVVLDKNGKRVAGDVRISELNRTATFVPAGGLQLGESYTVLLRGREGDGEDNGGTGFIRDVAGRPIQQVRLNVRTYRPRPISSFASPDAFKDIAIRRQKVGDDLMTRLFITTGGQSNNLASLDVSDPFKPSRIGNDTSLPSRQRVALIPDASFSYGNGPRAFRFTGDLAITTAFNVSRSFVTFVDVTNPQAPATIGTKVLTRVPEDFNQAFPVIWENAFAKGITAVQASGEVYAFAAVERVGLMSIDVGHNLPQQKLEPVYPGDITDVVAHRDVLFALDKTRGQAQLLTLGLSFEERAPATPLTSTPRRIRIGERLMSDLDGDGRVLTDEHVDVAIIGTDRDLQVFNIGDRSGRVGDVQRPKALELVARIPTKGTVRDVEIDPSRLRAIAIVDEVTGPVLIVVDLARLDGGQSTLELIDLDTNGHDDRIVFRHAFPTGVNGMRLDFERGLLYVGHPTGLEIWQVFDNCCDLGVDMTRQVRIRPSGRSAEVFAGELNAIKRGVVAGLLRAEDKCSIDVTKMRLIESGSSACLWRDDPEKACGNNYQPGLSDHDISTFMPNEWYNEMVPDPDWPSDQGPAKQIPRAACVVSALTFPFTDPYTEEPKNVEGTGYFFHDISFLPNWFTDFYSSNYRLDRTIEGIAGDADNDLGMGRQLQAMKHLTEAHGMDLRKVSGGPAVPQRFLAIHVEESEFERLFKQFRTITKVPAAEGFEWSVLMQFMFAKGKTYLRIGGSADEGSAFHKYNVKQIHMAGKAGIRAAVAKIVSMPSAREMFLGVRRSKKPDAEPDDPNDRGYNGQPILEFDRNACYVFRGDKAPARPLPPPFQIYSVEWDATRCGSMEEYAASTAIRTLTLPPAERPFTLEEVKNIITLYRIKADLETVTTDAEGDALIAMAIRFVNKVRQDTYPIYAQEVEAETSTDPKRAQRMANLDYAEGAKDDQGNRGGGRIKKFLEEAKLELVPHVYNRSFRNAPGVKLRMHLAKPGQNVASPYCGTEKEPLEDCAFQLNVAGGEHVYPAWRRKADDTLLLSDESSLAIPIFKLEYNVRADQNKSGHVAFTIDLQERTIKEAFRENNLGGFRYRILPLDGHVNIGPQQTDIPSPYNANAFAPDPECLAAPALTLTQSMTVSDDINPVQEKLASPVLLYQGQHATLQVAVFNPTPTTVTDTTVCTTLAAQGGTGGTQQACKSGITVAPNQTVPVSFPFMSKKPVVIESVATATSPDVGITTSQPFSVSVNCEPLIVFYDPDPNTLGPEFSVMAGGKAVRYARALNPFTGLPAYDTTVQLESIGSQGPQVFQALRGERAGLGTRDPQGVLSKDFEGMAFKIPAEFPFGQNRVKLVKVNDQDISCGVPIDLGFHVRPLEYTQSVAANAGFKAGISVELGLTGSAEGTLKFAFNVKRDRIAQSSNPLDVVMADLENIKSLDFEPTAGIGLNVSTKFALFEVKGGVKDLVEAKGEIGDIGAGVDFKGNKGNRFRFGGWDVFKQPPPQGQLVNAEVKELGSLLAFTLMSKGAYEILAIAEWIPPFRRPFEAVLKEVQRYEPRRTHTTAMVGVLVSAQGSLFKLSADVLPPEKDTTSGGGQNGGGGENGGGGQNGGGENGGDPPKKEPGKAFLNLNATGGGQAGASAILEQTQRLRQAPGDTGPLDKESWFNLEFNFNWKTEFAASLASWQASLDSAEFDEDEELNDKIKARGKEELGKVEKWIANGMEKVCAPNCNVDLSGNISFGVKSELETVNGVPAWVVKKVMVRFRSPKSFQGLPTDAEGTAGEFRLTYALDAKRYEPGSEEFKKLLARLFVKLKGLAFALTEEQRKRADELIAAVGLAGHGDFQPLVGIATRPPVPIDGKQVFNDFLGALRIIIGNGDVSEDVVKRSEKGLTLGGKIKVFGVGGEIEVTPLKFVREVEYVKGIGRLLEGKLFMLEDYSDITIGPFDPQAYLTNTVKTFIDDTINEVIRDLTQPIRDGIEAGKKVVGSAKATLKHAANDTVKALTWGYLGSEPLPDLAPAPYRPLDDQTRAGKVHYGIGGYLLFEGEHETLSEAGELEFVYEDAELAGAPEADVRLYRWNKQIRDWSVVSTATVNQATNTVTAAVTDLGLYTLGVLMPAGDVTWTVLSAVRSGSGADAVTTIQLESSVLRRNDGAVAQPGVLMHVKPVAQSDLNDDEAEMLGTVVTPDADATIAGSQVASDGDGRVRATVRIPGFVGVLYLQAFSDVGTANGSAAIVLPQP